MGPSCQRISNSPGESVAREPKSSIYCIQDSTRTQNSVCTITKLQYFSAHQQKLPLQIFSRSICKLPCIIVISALWTSTYRKHHSFFRFFSDPTFVFETVT